MLNCWQCRALVILLVGMTGRFTYASVREPVTTEAPTALEHVHGTVLDHLTAGHGSVEPSGAASGWLGQASHFSAPSLKSLANSATTINRQQCKPRQHMLTLLVAILGPVAGMLLVGNLNVHMAVVLMM